MSGNAAEFMGIPEGRYHWVPGEMVVIVRLPQFPVDYQQDMLVEQVRIQLNTLLAQYGIALEPYGTYGRWLNAPVRPPQPSFIFALHRKQPLIAIFFHTRHVDPNVSDPTPMALSYLQGHLEQLAQAGLQLVSSMPNWLVTAAPFFYADGGPALPPRPAPMLDVAAPPNALLGWHMQVLERGIPLDTKGAEDVVVAVLDTAHPVDRIRTAATRPELRRNWLLQRLARDLRNDDGPFGVEYDRYMVSNDICTGRDDENDARYYLMPDHGLSVAGLIRDIAPRARIRLIRILNDFGGSDLYALFAALTDLERELFSGSIRRLVINLSLTIMPDIIRIPYIWFAGRQWPSTQVMGVTRVLNQIEEGLRLLFEGLYAQGALVVAAAGNDSLSAVQQGLSRRAPRAPARYETTLSVTSLNAGFAASSFANAANIPPSSAGVATYGGDGHGALDKQGLPDAVRGIYISSHFPNGEQNLSGWADWCGSSLATPIISALGAHLMAQGLSASNIITRLSAGSERRDTQLFGAAPDVPEVLANMIRVQQHFGL
ncbi:MAG TPA: S8/S53 family peptidase [Ktedonosporobacter sp.]|nr:S8/S53 family peptidase [Ktedonosporobacter sp.]